MNPDLHQIWSRENRLKLTSSTNVNFLTVVLFMWAGGFGGYSQTNR